MRTIGPNAFSCYESPGWCFSQETSIFHCNWIRPSRANFGIPKRYSPKLTLGWCWNLPIIAIGCSHTFYKKFSFKSAFRNCVLHFRLCYFSFVFIFFVSFTIIAPKRPFSHLRLFHSHSITSKMLPLSTFAATHMTRFFLLVAEVTDFFSDFSFSSFQRRCFVIRDNPKWQIYKMVIVKR